MTAEKMKYRRKPSRKPDYEGYEQYKRTLWNIPLTDKQYETLIRAAARKYGV